MGFWAVVADKLEETVIENSALKVFLELLSDVSREHPPLGPRLDRRKEGLHVFCNELIENCQLWPAAVVFDRKSAHEAQLTTGGVPREVT